MSKRTPKPAWVDGYPNYEDMVRGWGFKVDHFATFGSYQGDHLAIIEGPITGVGLIVFGYGSCSGCDELEAVAPRSDDEDWSAVVNLSARLFDQVHWEEGRDALRDWIDANPQNHWWSYDDEIAAWLDVWLGTSLRKVDK